MIFKISLSVSLFLHILVFSLLFFTPSFNKNLNSGLNLKQGEKFESIMIISELPIGEVKEVSINQKQSIQSQNTKINHKPSSISNDFLKEKTKLQASAEFSHKITEKNKKENSITNNTNSPNSKAKDQSLSAPIKSEEKITQTLVSGNAKKQIQNYQAVLMAHLLKFQRYPKEALINKQEGKVNIKVSIDELGNVTSKNIKKLCPHSILNNEAINLITRASPLPKPPQEILKNSNQITFILPINYNIKDFLNKK